MSLSKILVGLSVVAAAGLALWLTAELTSREKYEELVLDLPQPLRLHYLNYVFHSPTEDCAGCYYQLIGTLDALEDHAEAGAGFDYMRLLPLLRTGPGEIREPVPGQACALILRRRDPQLYRAMAAAFKEDEDSLKSCVVFQLGTLKQLHPAEYESVSRALLEVPELSKYVTPLSTQ
jgi:hypothetical protein